ncbi:MAG TPA: hypothetical protein VHH36_05720 [Candidatus Thermoplasmatota archaeon]|nr:hypothetical protein [Candidatus Thermoplasmatota archaeon]
MPKPAFLGLLLILPAFAAPTGVAPCSVGLPDDGTHSVSQTGLDVTANTVGVDVDCFGVSASVSEVLWVGPAMACQGRIPTTSNGVLGAWESGGTVYVDTIGVGPWSCAGVRVAVDEILVIP